MAVHAPSDGVDLLDGSATVVKSPGVPQEAPVVAGARRRGIRVVGELEIGWRLLPNDFVAITGSNGKTTTTELVGHIHRQAGASVVVAGNVGTALTTLPGAIERSAVVICEASSFQLEDTEAFAPDAAVLLNLAEDHLDRYRSVDAYRKAKLQAFARQPAEAVAVAPPALVGELGGAGERVTFGGPGADVELRDGRLCWRGKPFMDAAEVRLRGAHNLENAMAAAAVCLARGIARRRRAVRPRELRRRAAPARGGRHGPRRPLRQRLEGDQRRVGGGGDRVVPRRRARDPRRPRQAQRLRPARRAAGRAGARGVPDRRGRPRARRRADAGPGCRCTSAATWPPRSPPRAPPRSPATSCCSRRPARRTTSTGRSRSAASISGRSSKGVSRGRRSQA